jgi:DNA-binding response OmpR family regulator
MNKVLLIEDDASLGKSIAALLQQEGFEISIAVSLSAARQVDLNSVDIVVLDWMLPDGQGIDFLKEIRRMSQTIPVIMLTARADLIDKIVGLESGANDYMTKPFEPRELIARIRVQLRGVGEVDNSVVQLLKVGELEIDRSAHIITFNGKNIELTKMEYELLLLLAEDPGKAFSREEILNKVWGYNNFPTTRTVDTHILQLRQKLADNLIETVRGIGYRLKID